MGAALARNKHTPVDATSAALTMTLPASDNTVGDVITVEKVDPSNRAVTISGTIRGASTTLTLTSRYETVELVAESASSWRVVASHRTKTAQKNYPKIFAPRPAFTPLFPVKVSSDAPTITSTDSTVGGATSAYLALPQIRWTDSRLTFLGCLKGQRTFSGTVTMQNVASGHYSAAGPYPLPDVAPYEVEFDYYGTVLKLADLAPTTGMIPYQLYIDGEAASATPLTLPSVAATVSRFTTFTWATARKRRLRFLFPANFAFRSFAAGDTNYAFNAVPKPALSIMVVGDSWSAGTGADYSITSFPMLMSRLTGWEVYQNGAGGTATAPRG